MPATSVMLPPRLKNISPICAEENEGHTTKHRSHHYTGFGGYLKGILSL